MREGGALRSVQRQRRQAWNSWKNERCTLMLVLQNVKVDVIVRSRNFLTSMAAAQKRPRRDTRSRTSRKSAIQSFSRGTFAHCHQ